ncbi:MAG: hypothetical protein ACI8RT_000792 [Candidatus Azotimanducaceae bacterium]|jgi:hypothetical protein|tara:strand:- start:23 stop:688 length:666 start_codon:yes stop_codon:yes gene_type:complete
MNLLVKVLVIVLGVALVPTTAVITAAAKQSSADGPNRVFSGGPLTSGELYSGAEPDWRFLSDVPTLELQLLNPPESRRIWVAEVRGKMYVWSGYMNSFFGKIWKTWPGQAVADGRAVVRIEGIRYERQLKRIQTGDVLDEIAAVISAKYPSQATRAVIDSGDLWVFEVAPRNESVAAAETIVEESALEIVEAMTEEVTEEVVKDTADAVTDEVVVLVGDQS